MSSSRRSSTSSSTEEICSICMDSLDSKRSVILHPCNHRFHRTCIISWFEAGKCMMPGDYTCVLCRTECEKAIDEKEEIVPRFFPFEKKEGMETFIRMLPNYEERHVTMHCELNNAIEVLNNEKKQAMRKKKSKEFIVDIIEEIEKLKERSTAVEEIIITLAVEVNSEYLRLYDEKDRIENEMENVDNSGAVTGSRKIVNRKEEELEKITKQMNAIEEEVRGRFREKCSKMAAQSTAAAAAPTSKTAASATVTTRRVTAKRRMNSEESSRVQPKRKCK